MCTSSCMHLRKPIQAIQPLVAYFSGTPIEQCWNIEVQKDTVLLAGYRAVLAICYGLVSGGVWEGSEFGCMCGSPIRERNKK